MSVPARVKRLGPRTFQVRLTFGFLGIVVLTLGLVSALVLNRLDNYFVEQRDADLEDRAQSVAQYVAVIARETSGVRPVVTPTGLADQTVLYRLRSTVEQQIIANTLARADVQVRLGSVGGAGFVPATNGATEAVRSEPPRKDEAPEELTAGPFTYSVRGFMPYEIEVTLARPYTYRMAAVANVSGLLAAIGLLALGLSIIVAAVLARRFTTPLRQLTDASRALAEGDLSSRVPASVQVAGSAEIGELASQFNTMAAQLEESITIIRRDRDRSRDFLADVSHELRTPIAAVRMFNELLREHGEQDPAARREFLESTAQQLDRLDWLAQNLLDLSRLDSGLALLDLRPDDLRAAVESSVEQARPTARKRDIALHLKMPEAPLRLPHDPQRIGQVLANLIGNAIKFTPPGGSVFVEVGPAGDGARIEVRDTGVGIDASELPRIFERFYRGSQVNEARGSGSGLGLAIVRSIVEMHGGTVTVESGVGVGSRFTVLLPHDARPPETPVAHRSFERPVGEPLAARSDATEPLAPAGPTASDDLGTAPPPAVTPEPRLLAAESNVADSSPADRSRLNPGTSP